MTVKPGDRVVFWTQDCFEGRIKTEADKPSDILEMPYINPQCGLVMIEGAEKGDAVAVYIEAMLPRGDNPHGHAEHLPRQYRLAGRDGRVDPFSLLLSLHDTDDKRVASALDEMMETVAR